MSIAEDFSSARSATFPRRDQSISRREGFFERHPGVLHALEFRLSPLLLAAGVAALSFPLVSAAGQAAQSLVTSGFVQSAFSLTAAQVTLVSRVAEGQTSIILGLSSIGIGFLAVKKFLSPFVRSLIVLRKVAGKARQSGKNVRTHLTAITKDVWADRKNLFSIAAVPRALRDAAFLREEKTKDVVVSKSLRIGAGCSREFASEVEEAWNGLPENIRSFLTLAKVTVEAGRTAREMRLPEEKNKKVWRNDPYKRIYYDHVCGVYENIKRKISVYEFTLWENLSPDAVAVPNVQTLMEGAWQRKPPGEYAKVLRHEAGHALDFALDNTTRNGLWSCLSSCPSFKEAYEKDVAALGGIKAAAEKGYKYFVVYGESLTNPEIEVEEIRARREIFAEMWSEQYGGSVCGKKVERDFPAVAAWMRSFNKNFENCLKEGPQRALDFATYLHRGHESIEGIARVVDFKGISYVPDWGRPPPERVTPPGTTPPPLPSQKDREGFSGPPHGRKPGPHLSR